MLLGAVALCGLTASADITWEQQDNRVFLWGQSGSANFIDLNNDGRLDILTTGTGSLDANQPDYTGAEQAGPWKDKPGVYSWQGRTSIYYNNGDGTWTPNIMTPVEDGTEMVNKKDDDGNDILDGEGNPIQEERTKYKLDWKHGIAPMNQSKIVPFDYNNDGLVDLFIICVSDGNDLINEIGKLGGEKKTPSGNNAGVFLYKNLGNEKFEFVPDHGIPPIYLADDEDKGDAMYYNSVSVADYDHDGYNDLLVCGKLLDREDEKIPAYLTAVFHNEGGSGKFVRKDIAKVQGGVYTNEIVEKDDEGNVIEVIEEKQLLPGWFLPTRENCHFADLNNDGWADIITIGQVDNVYDGVNENGQLVRVYLNKEGENGERYFDDVTPLTPNCDRTVAGRGGRSCVADFDKDGYLDFFFSGWSDNGGGPIVSQFINQLGWSDEIFDAPAGREIIQNQDGQEGEWLERTNTHFRDFDGDGTLDVSFEGKGDYFFYFGQPDGTFMRSASDFNGRGYNCRDGVGAYGDLTGNGLCDFFQVGYIWTKVTQGYLWGRNLYFNKTDVEVPAPAVPTEVAATLADGKLTVTWKDVEDADEYTCAYNIVVKKPNGEIFSIIPADLETGAVRITDGKEACIRPTVESYTMDAPANGEYTVGVQAVSLYNERYSQFATTKVGESAIENIVANSHNLKVEIAGDDVTVVTDRTEPVKIVNILGQTVAEGMTNQPVNVSATGVLVVLTADKKVKIAK